MYMEISWGLVQMQVLVPQVRAGPAILHFYQTPRLMDAAGGTTPILGGW